MSEHYRRIRVHTAHGYLLFREGISISFYMHRPHSEVAQAVWTTLKTYLRAVGPAAIGRYIDVDGSPRRLDEAGWNLIREELLESTRAIVSLRDALEAQHRYRFDYHGHPREDCTWSEGFATVCAVSFWLPTEFLEEHGPERVRELAMELARPLPFCSGHAGLSFNGETVPLSRYDVDSSLCFRYPGVDMADLGTLAWTLGTRLRGASWLTFLGSPVLEELGGVEGLRSHLSSPGTHVQELEHSRAVVTLGPHPEAGDLEQGHTLPAYRELARLLEPWLYHDPLAFKSNPEWLRWERRFLD